MKLNIIECKNINLSHKLSQLDPKDSVVSVTLPQRGQPLPDDIKAAIELYIINSKNEDKQVNIIIEINQWMDQSQATMQLMHMKTLLQQFFSDAKKPLPNHRLLLFKDNQFIGINKEQDTLKP